MKFTIFNENDSVLLVGEGNFSFSVALFHLNLRINITATCYEASVNQEFGKKNIEYLKNNGWYLKKNSRFLYIIKYILKKFYAFLSRSSRIIKC